MAIPDVHSIGAVSKRTGCKIETIRYYERAGLLPNPPRSDGGHRLYTDDQVRRLRFIRRSRELGFSLAEVRTLLGLVDGGYTCKEVQTLTLDHLSDIQSKIADLRKLEDSLRAIAANCEGSDVPECPIIDALFE